MATHVHVYVALSSPQLRETWMRGEQQMDQLVCVSLSLLSPCCCEKLELGSAPYGGESPYEEN